MDNTKIKGDFNRLPEYSFKISEIEFWENLLSWEIPTSEYRQILVGDYTSYNFSLHKGLWKTRIYWLNNSWKPEHYLGFGVMKRNDEIIYFKIGATNHWSEFMNNFANQFANDRT